MIPESPDALGHGRSERFQRAIDAIDAANADDPETIEVDGVARPKELTHASMMCAYVLDLDPTADECQLLAARAHHLRRWALPRSEHPEGRAGYLKWRAEQKRRHAAEVAEIMESVGYGADDIARVGGIVRKEQLRTDPAVQVHEDALCLVFLATQFDPLAAQLGDDKMVDVLVKTMRKMSAEGLAAAATLDLGERASALIGRAAAMLPTES